jgi:hypothetical protein
MSRHASEKCSQSGDNGEHKDREGNTPVPVGDTLRDVLERKFRCNLGELTIFSHAARLIPVTNGEQIPGLAPDPPLDRADQQTRPVGEFDDDATGGLRRGSRDRDDCIIDCPGIGCSFCWFLRFKRFGSRAVQVRVEIGGRRCRASGPGESQGRASLDRPYPAKGVSTSVQ